MMSGEGEIAGIPYKANAGVRIASTRLSVDINRNITLSLQAQNLMPKKSATSEYSNFNTTALNSYALSERRFSVGVRAKF